MSGKVITIEIGTPTHSKLCVVRDYEKATVSPSSTHDSTIDAMIEQYCRSNGVSLEQMIAVIERYKRERTLRKINGNENGVSS